MPKHWPSWGEHWDIVTHARKSTNLEAANVKIIFTHDNFSFVLHVALVGVSASHACAARRFGVKPLSRMSMAHTSSGPHSSELPFHDWAAWANTSWSPSNSQRKASSEAVQASQDQGWARSPAPSPEHVPLIPQPLPPSDVPLPSRAQGKAALPQPLRYFASVWEDICMC